jgi:hypothetical protein
VFVYAFSAWLTTPIRRSTNASSSFSNPLSQPAPIPVSPRPPFSFAQLVDARPYGQLPTIDLSVLRRARSTRHTRVCSPCGGSMLGWRAVGLVGRQTRRSQPRCKSLPSPSSPCMSPMLCHVPSELVLCGGLGCGRRQRCWHAANCFDSLHASAGRPI